MNKRFKMPDYGLDGKKRKDVYLLVDAFWRSIFVNNKVVNFSRELEESENDDLYFAELDEDFKQLITAYREETASTRQQDVVLALAEWFWKVGMSDVVTTCGNSGKKLGIAENTRAFQGRLGLWNSGQATSRKDESIKGIVEFFYQIATMSPENLASLDMVKKTIVRKYGGKSNNKSFINGILHFADPDKYIHLFIFDDKVSFLNRYDGYDSRRDIDEQVCELFDRLRKKFEDDSYDDFCHRCVYTKKLGK